MRSLAMFGCLVAASLTFSAGLADQPSSPPLAPQLTGGDVFVVETDWQLPEGHWVAAKMPMTLVHPRPDSETNAWARHRKAYPGLEYRIPIAVQGGAYPFRYKIMDAPTWLSIGETVWEADYGVLHGTPPLEEDGSGTQKVKIRVYGQEYERATGDTVGPTYLDAEFELRVTSSTADFIFVDASAEKSGDGSIGSPLRTFAEIIDGDAPSTFPGRTIYFRAGYYHTTEFWGASWKGEGNSGELNYGSSYKHTWLGYPGEEAIVSFERATLKPRDDFYVGGMRLRHTTQRAVKPSGWAGAARFFIFEGAARFTLFESELKYGKFAWVDRMFDLEYVSPTQFKVLGYDASVKNIYTITVDGGSVNQGGNQLRFYDYAAPLTEPHTHVGHSRVIESVFDGTDTLVTMLDPVVPMNLQRVRQLYRGGNNGHVYTSLRNPNRTYLAVWGNRFSDSETNSIGSLYSTKLSVIENNEFVDPVPGSTGKVIFLKSSNDSVSIRRNLIIGDPVNDRVLEIYAGRTVENVPLKVEVAYNVIDSSSDMSGLSIGQSANTGATDENPYQNWVYRNTFLGAIKTSNNQPHEIFYENNLVFADQASVYGTQPRTFVEGDIVHGRSSVANHLGDNYRMKGPLREQRLGTHGHEISR